LVLLPTAPNDLWGNGNQESEHSHMRMLRTKKMGARQALAGAMLGALLPIVATIIPVISAFPGTVQAQGSVIRDIRVEGNRRLEPETVRSYMKLSVGESYDEAKADETIRALFATGLFSDVKISRTSTGVVVTVVENPVINQVAFEGNSEVEKSALEAEVQLKSRAVFTRAKAQADVQRILDVYRRQGRFAASVTPKLIELDNNSVNVVFEINEGQATKVKSIAFVGNRVFSDSQLRDIITTIQSGLFDFLKGTNIYDPDRLNLDKELLRQYYLKNGYADARIISANAELDRDGSGFFITFVIEEGQVFNFGAVSIESKLAGVNTASLNSQITTKEGDVFNATLLDKSIEAITLKVAEQGFAFGRVRLRTDRIAGTNTISVVYVVEEGPRVYIERINVNGNERTKDYVVRREFKVAEGDAYNQLLVENAKKRLQGLGFFKTVEIKRRNGASTDRVILDVDLVEQPTGELSFGAGFSTSEGVIGDVSITERNLLGNGQFLRAGVSGSKERLNINLGFTEPRFLGSNVVAGFDIFRNTTTATSSTPYSTSRTGGGVRFAFPLAESVWLNTGYSLSRDTVTIPSAYNSIASRALKEACGFTDDFVDVNGLRPGQLGYINTNNTNNGSCDNHARWNSMGSVGFTVDKRNHPKTPTSGTFFQTGVDVAGLGGDVHYARLNAEGRAYYPVAEKVTLVTRAAGGHIMGIGGQDVRLLDLFYKGGETIRGFGNLGYGPRDLSSVNRDALGGRTYWTATAELRFPIPAIPEELGMSGAVFADAGSLFNAGALAKSLNAKCGTGTDPDNTQRGVCLADDAKVRSSVGASLLWNSPLGPLRIDVAKALSKAEYDKTQIFRFGASTKF
jgi:outer membrane protein insertion porin family